MSCERFKRLISRAFDAELTVREEEDLKDHLEDCAQCRELNSRIKRSAQLFEAVSRVEPSVELDPDFPERIAARVMESRLRRRPGMIQMAVAFTFLALMIGGFAGYVIRPSLTRLEKAPAVPKVSSIRLNSSGLGVEIEGDRFVLHTRDKAGGGGIDLKF